MQAGLGSVAVPGSEVGMALRMAGSNEQDVALSDHYALLPLAALELVGVDVLAGLQPTNPAQRWHVQQHAAPDEPLLERSDVVGSRSLVSQ